MAILSAILENCSVRKDVEQREPITAFKADVIGAALTPTL
jgi:hypothetical protein